MSLQGLDYGTKIIIGRPGRNADTISEVRRHGPQIIPASQASGKTSGDSEGEAQRIETMTVL